ncbi:hypothetical protein PC118_g20011 [Phytophthora cactorum]|uniref:Cytochrome P450 n=1 Tax=Phytophthora cactorum TaxID=29920 RepID=A0A8T1F0G7_9STRA|nr:hypothetical protein PC118_g20011 [Phytophthora cactorum]
MLPPSLLRSDGKLAFSSSFLLGLLAVTAFTALYTINSRKTNNHKDKTDHATSPFDSIAGEYAGEIGFGRKLGNLASPDAHPFELAFDEAHRISGYRFTTPAWLWKLKRWLNVGSERHLRDSVVVINEFLMDTIVGTMERRQHESVEVGGPTAKLDIMSIILDTMEASGQIITSDDIRDIVFAGMIAGRDTTADALSWLMHALHNNPRVVKYLREEILEKLPKFAESESYVPSMDEEKRTALPGGYNSRAFATDPCRSYDSLPVCSRHCVPRWYIHSSRHKHYAFAVLGGAA